MKVLISGALFGLGAQLTKVFLEAGHHVFAGVHHTEDLGELEAVMSQPQLTILPLDVSNSASIDAAVKQLKEKTQELDIVINVAGVLLNRENYIIQDSYADINTTFQVNTIGPLYLNNLLFDLLKKSPQGTIINISSEVLSIDGVGAMFGTYIMSKTAIAQYGYILKSTCLALGLNLRVFSLHPGRMKTKMGAENGQIEAWESARGIYKIAVGEVLEKNEHIYINYKGEPML